MRNALKQTKCALRIDDQKVAVNWFSQKHPVGPISLWLDVVDKFAGVDQLCIED